MKPLLFRSLWLFAFAAFSLASRAQQGGAWDLERCIRYAIEHNIQVKQGDKSVDLSRLDNQQAKMSYLPSLNANAGYNASFGRSLDPTTYEYVSGKSVNNVNGGMSLNTQLFAGMQKLHTLRRSEFNLMNSLQEVERIKNEISIAVAGAYLQVLYGKEQVAVSQSNIANLKLQVDHTSKLVEAGSLALGNRLELEAQLAAEEYNLTNYENQLTIALLSLTQLLELRDVPDFDVEVPDFSDKIAVTPPWSVDDIYAQALGLPQVETERLRTKIAEQDLKLARSRYYPTLNFGANYGSSYSDSRQRPIRNPDGSTSYGKYSFIDQFADNASTSLQFSMNIPLFNSLNTRRNVERMRVTLSNAELGLSLAQSRLYKEIQQAWADASGALSRMESAQSGVRSGEESFRYAEEKLRAQAITSVDYNSARNTLIAAQSRLLQAKYEYLFKIKILDFYRGTPITL